MFNGLDFGATLREENSGQRQLPFPGMVEYLQTAIYADLRESIDNNWIKAGTIGSRVTARLSDGRVYNKPIVNDALRSMARSTLYPGFEYHSEMGARVSQAFRLSQGLGSFTPGNQSCELLAERKSVERPQPVNQGSVSTNERRTFSKFGITWISDDGYATVPVFPSCQHANVFSSVGFTKCAQCHCIFHEPKQFQVSFQ